MYVIHTHFIMKYDDALSSCT